MNNKVFKILVIIFIVIPWTILGLIAVVLSLLCLDPFGAVVGAAILLAQFLTVKGLMRKRVATTKEQIAETPQSASTSTSDVIFCNRCGGAMDASCKYCRDCGAPRKVKEE